MAKLVSTIIPNYNGRHLLVECLEAVLRQTYPNQEVIVVDNGSTDGSQALVRDRFPTVRLLELRENLGVSGGDNRGIEMARGDYLALLNNDAVPEPNWLEELCRVMDDDPSLGCCTPRLMIHGTNLINEAGLSWTVWGHSRTIGWGQACQEKYLQKREVFGAGSGATLYRRRMVDEIGLFDEDFFICEEDLDLIFRARLADYRCVYVPTAVVRHHCSATIGKNLTARVFYSIRNAEFVFIKNMPGPLVWKYLLRHLFYFVGINVIGLCRGRAVPVLRADWQILAGLPRLLQKRREIQGKRKVSLDRLESLFEQETYWELVWSQLKRWQARKAHRNPDDPLSRIPKGPAWD